MLIGIDIGGTTVRTVQGAPGLGIHRQQSQPTRGQSREILLAQLAALTTGGRLERVGVGVPGVLHPTDRSVTECPNVPGLEGPGLHQDLERALGAEVVLVNDVNAAALGEARRGAGRGIASFAFISVGTSVGMGMMLDGELWTGHAGGAGELAALPVGITFEEFLSLGPTPLDRKLSGRALLALGPAGRTEVARFAALAAAGVQAVLDPEVIVLGGGVGTFPEFLRATEHALEELPGSRRVRLRPGELGTDAGAIGALELAASAG